MSLISTSVVVGDDGDASGGDDDVNDDVSPERGLQQGSRIHVHIYTHTRHR